MNTLKTGFFTGLFILLLSGNVFSCDMCGCFMGVYPTDKRSFAGVFYRYRSFAGKDVTGSKWFPDGAFKTQHSDHTTTTNYNNFEVYRAVEFRGRYYFHPRVEFNLVVPLIYNKSFDAGANQSVSGIGDATMMLGWQIIDEGHTGALIHRLLVGGGFKIASGDCNKMQQDVRISLMMQPGTGSNDEIVYANYQVGYNRLGLSIVPVFKLNGENRFSEKVSDSRTINSSLFYRFEPSEDLKIIPSAQLYYEYTEGISVEGVIMKGSGMNTLMTGIGTDVLYRNMGLSLLSMMPAYEKDTGSGLKSRVKMMVGLTWYFDQSNFIFKSRKKD